MIKNTNKSKERVLWLLCFFMIALVALFGRMFYWQIIKGPELKSAAYTQQTKNRTHSESAHLNNGTPLHKTTAGLPLHYSMELIFLLLCSFLALHI